MKIKQQRGVALLVVLILLVMMSVLAGRISQQFCRNLQKTRYQMSQQQLFWAMRAQEKQINDLLQEEASGQDKPLSPTGRWREPIETRTEHYSVESTLSDGQNCFNVNSLQVADEVVDATAESSGVKEKSPKEQVVEALFEQAGISAATAETLYTQLVDYVDEDELTASGGQESDAWAGTQPARLPANQLMRTLGEIKSLPAFAPAAWPRITALFCALPDTTALVDVNTLQAEQSPLLSALFLGALSEDDAARLIAARPEAGWESQKAFEEQVEKQFPTAKEGLEKSREFLSVNSQYFRVSSVGTTDDLTLRVITQIHVDNGAGEVKAWQRRYKIVE